MQQRKLVPRDGHLCVRNVGGMPEQPDLLHEQLRRSHVGYQQLWIVQHLVWAGNVDLHRRYLHVFGAMLGRLLC
jgi:hypothetical protein